MNVLANVLGWGGSIVLVVSLLQPKVRNLRLLNLIAAVVLVVYNAMIASWPMVAMNVAIAGINIYFLSRMNRTLRSVPPDGGDSGLPAERETAR